VRHPQHFVQYEPLEHRGKSYHDSQIFVPSNGQRGSGATAEPGHGHAINSFKRDFRPNVIAAATCTRPSSRAPCVGPLPSLRVPTIPPTDYWGWPRPVGVNWRNRPPDANCIIEFAFADLGSVPA
jgi:hypothetical protein